MRESHSNQSILNFTTPFQIIVHIIILTPNYGNNVLESPHEKLNYFFNLLSFILDIIMNFNKNFCCYKLKDTFRYSTEEKYILHNIRNVSGIKEYH